MYSLYNYNIQFKHLADAFIQSEEKSKDAVKWLMDCSW